MAVRIRMKKFGRRHRPFYRICAMDSRSARDGRVLEELGTYDPLVPETNARAILNKERIQYWLSVGASPSEKVSALIKKYGAEGTHVEEQQRALDRLAQSRRRPEPRTDFPKPAPRKKEAPTGDAPAASAPADPQAEAVSGEGGDQ